MWSLTFDHLRTASAAGGVSVVSLQAIGDAFCVRVTTRNNTQPTLSRARSTGPHAFTGLAEADDSNTPWLSLEQAKASWTAKRAALLEPAKASGARAD